MSGRFVRYLNESNLLVSLAAGVYCWQQIYSVKGETILYFPLLTFFATWLAYMLIKGEDFYGAYVCKRVVLTALILLFLFMPIEWWAVYLIPLACMIVYKPLPFFRSQNITLLSLRTKPLLKTVSISIAWTWTAFVAPLWISGQHVIFSDKKFLLQALVSFCLIASLSIAGDIRDARLDKGKILNWSELYSLRVAKAVAIVLMIFSAVFSLLLLSVEQFPLLFAELGFVVVGILLLAWVHPNRNWHYQTMILDGYLLVRSLSLLLVYCVL